MRIRRLNENIEPMSKIEFIDPMEICPECGAIAMHLTDMSPLDIPDKYVSFEMGINFDDEIYAESICDNCGNKENIKGKITWQIKDEEKRNEYMEMYKKGIDPIEIKKYNL